MHMFRSAERFKRENINLVLLPAAGRDGGGEAAVPRAPWFHPLNTQEDLRDSVS